MTDCETGVTYNKKIIALNSCVDSVARPKLQNRSQFNGKSSCSYCYHPGKLSGGSIRHCLLKDDPELRTHASHLKDLNDSYKLRKVIRGVKGYSVLLELEEFDIVWSLPPDYMHGS